MIETQTERIERLEQMVRDMRLEVRVQRSMRRQAQAEARAIETVAIRQIHYLRERLDAALKGTPHA